MRYDELSDEELQKKAEEAGIKKPGNLTREQLVAQLAEKGDTGEGEGKGSDFVTPVAEQGTEPSAADEEKREPLKDNQPQGPADQSSQGGTITGQGGGYPGSRTTPTTPPTTPTTTPPPPPA